ncbi:ABC transporter substrate-binding protein [Lutispora saccharofermentans]|uniref:ABC transporter substrate-binding protein n=1 Tax=Lutispora saccharofermentans TaxID=3024236 RepID=A0ABT1NB07_9FIRM|nr:ABC transporter substrate-binding protein [Lutispora saccharofermentans]MCQ1528445.1 ABC transporter substrate-binding protein [Lutispora saccharofermentans]
MKLKLKRMILILFVLLLLPLLASCQREANKGAEDAAKKVEITDIKGRSVVLEKKPEKIVSLSPTNTEIVFALGAGKKLVGVTSFCDYPEEAKSVEVIGDFENPNIEMIKKVNPDVVLAGGYIQEDIIEALEGLDIPVISTEASDIDSIFDSIAMIGKLVGAEANAEEIINNMHKSIDNIKSKVGGKDRPKVFYLVWKDPIFTVGQGTFINEIIQIAGGRNIAEETQGWSKYSPEELIKQNPDILIASYHATDEGMRKEDFEKDDFFQKLECVKKGNIHIMSDDNIVARPGPRIVDAICEMAKVLHSDAF